MKRFFAVLLALMLLAGCVPAGAAVLTKAEQYDAALEELKAYLNDDSAILVDDLFEQFSALGSYEYSAELAIYTRVLKDIYNGEFARLPQLLAYLRMNGAFCAWLQEDGELGSVDQLEWYAKGLEAEREGKWMEAARCFEQSIPFKDSFQRSITLQENWLEERYQQAMTYYRQDTYAGYQQAYEIFQELAAYGGYKDSNNYMAMADILRATPAPTVAPTPKPTPLPTATPKPKLAVQKNKLAIGYNHTVGVNADGTVVAVGENKYGSCEVNDWQEIVFVSASHTHTVGLKADGTVIAVGLDWYGMCDVQGWRDIVAVAAGSYYTVGLKSDGTVVAVGNNDYGQCNVEGWENIVSIAASANHTVGLKADGTVVATGYNESGSCDVEDWRDIQAIGAGSNCTIGLRKNGTLVSAGEDDWCKSAVRSWLGIKSFSVKYRNIVVLRSNGKAQALLFSHNADAIINEWQDIISVAVGDNCVAALREDGKVEFAGSNTYGRGSVQNWNLLK